VQALQLQQPLVQERFLACQPAWHQPYPACCCRMGSVIQHRPQVDSSTSIPAHTLPNACRWHPSRQPSIQPRCSAAAVAHVRQRQQPSGADPPRWHAP
jgi:hypothetical protein